MLAQSLPPIISMQGGSGQGLVPTERQCALCCCLDQWQGCLLCSLSIAPTAMWQLQGLLRCAEHRNLHSARHSLARPCAGLIHLGHRCCYYTCLCQIVASCSGS